MLKKAPTASAIRTANRNAVGGGPKRCRKGKNCSATCIDAGKACLVGLPEPASLATARVAKMLEERIAKNASAQTGSGGGATDPLDAFYKVGDTNKLKNLENEMEYARKEWGDTIGKGDVEKTKRLSATFQYTKKQYDDFKKEYDDKYNRPEAKTPKELMAQEATRVKERMNKRLEEGISYYKPEQKAPILAKREEAIKDFRKLSDDQLAALGLYGGKNPNYYVDVNRALRTGSLEGIAPERYQTVLNIINNLEGALGRLPASSDTQFERAVSGGGARGLRNLKVGDIIEDKGFGSYTVAGKPATLDQFFRQGEDNALMRVTSRNARKVSPAMEFERENEHIIRPGAKFRVVEIAEDGHRSRTVGSMPTYVFEEVTE